VLVRTGYGALWADPAGYLRGAGVSAAGSSWLIDQKVSAVGADNMAWDVMGPIDPELGVTLPGHVLLLVRAGIPIVETWEIPPAPIDAVAGFNNYEAGCAVARHLVAQGRQSLAFIGGDDPRATRRWNGFKDTALQAGVKMPRRLILDRNASGSVVALAELPDVDAVFAANDAHAIGFMSGLRAAGLLRDGPAAAQPVAVIGLGDLEMGRLIAPSLSTIRVHGDAIGRTAAKLMLTRQGPRHIDLGFELVLRDSG